MGLLDGDNVDIEFFNHGSEFFHFVGETSGVPLQDAQRRAGFGFASGLFPFCRVLRVDFPVIRAFLFLQALEGVATIRFHTGDGVCASVHTFLQPGLAQGRPT